MRDEQILRLVAEALEKVSLLPDPIELKCSQRAADFVWIAYKALQELQAELRVQGASDFDA